VSSTTDADILATEDTPNDLDYVTKKILKYVYHDAMISLAGRAYKVSFAACVYSLTAMMRHCRSNGQSRSLISAAKYYVVSCPVLQADSRLTSIRPSLPIHVTRINT
jgi:hypothetical protein